MNSRFNLLPRRVSPRRIVFSLMLVSVMLLSACAQVIPQTGSQPSVINLDVSDTAVTAPQSVPAGITTFAVKHSGQAPRSVSFGRLNTGVTVDQLSKMLFEDQMKAVELVSLTGGAEATPGKENRVTLDLKEGTYVAIAFPRDEGAPVIGSFQVGPASGKQAEAPKAGVTVDMADFSFIMPDSLKAGKVVWEVKNTGKQWHELVVLKPQEGFTQEQFFEMAQSEEPPAGQPPFEEVGFFGPVTEGERGWVDMDLKPGTYWAVCFLPDIAGQGEPHLVKGMFKEFTVEE